MKGKITLALAALFLCVCPAIGTIHFNDGLTHDINYAVNDSTYVDYQTPAMYTTINWLDGGIMSPNYQLKAYEQSRVNVRGGSIWDLYSYKYSTVYFSGGSIDYRFWSHDSSHLNISGGTVSFLHSFHSSQIDIYGGTVKDLKTGHSSQINIYGGSIGPLYLKNSSKIQIFGYNFAVNGQPFGYGELTSIYHDWPSFEPRRYLTGTLLSGELIDNYFRIGERAKIILTIPEPTLILLLGLGGLLLRKRRKKK